MSKLLTTLCALLMLVLAPSVKADPIVVTSGSLSVTGSGGGPHYSFSGANFSVTNVGGDQGNSPSCFPCLSGSLQSINSVFTGSSLGTGSLTVDGMTFDNVLLRGNFQFTGSPILIPAATTNISLTGAFTFTGFIAACALEESPDCGASNAIFSTDLVGQGIATVQLNFFRVNANGQSEFFFNSITYTFQSAEIPEPMTLTLLTFGVIGLGVKRTFEKRRSRKPPFN